MVKVQYMEKIECETSTVCVKSTFIKNGVKIQYSTGLKSEVHLDSKSKL